MRRIMAWTRHSSGSAGTARMPAVEEIAYILLTGHPMRIVIIAAISRAQAMPVKALPAYISCGARTVCGHACAANGKRAAAVPEPDIGAGVMAGAVTSHDELVMRLRPVTLFVAITLISHATRNQRRTLCTGISNPHTCWRRSWP